MLRLTRILLGAAAAMAGAIAVPAAAQELPAKMGGITLAVVPQSRPDAKGDRYSFVAMSEQFDQAETSFRDEKDTQAFDVEILDVRPDGMTLAYTQTSSEVQGGNAYQNSMLESLNGVRLVFETDKTGAPKRIVNWADASAQITAAFVKANPGSPDAGPRIRAWLDSLSPQIAAEQAFGNDLTAMSAVQMRHAIVGAHFDLPSDTHPQPNGHVVTARHTMDLKGFGPTTCVFELERASWTDNAGSGDSESSLKTNAHVSALDGWVLDLTETQTILSSADHFKRTHTLSIKRVSAPRCR